MIKKGVQIILSIYLIIFAQVTNASDPITVKLAVLDSPNMPQKSSLWLQYENAYIAGIETAVEAAKSKNINIVYKTFFFGVEPLDIFNEIPKVKIWQPDFIIGPHYSNQFLLLKKYFTDTLILSAYASDPELETLPKNFYSLSLPDKDWAKGLNNFLENKFPNKNVYLLIQGDCKACVSLSKLFLTKYQENKEKNHLIATADFLQDDIDSIEINKLIKNHSEDVILIISATYYIYNTLINRIANAYPGKNLIFVTSVDNWGNSIKGNASSKINALSYKSYRIAPTLDSIYLPEYDSFKKIYFQKYHNMPSDAVSYITYVTVMSMVAALQNFQDEEHNTVKEKILFSYLNALNKEPNWFRPKKYSVYLLTKQGEEMIETLSLSETGK